MEGFFTSAVFRELLRNSCYKNPLDAVTKEFFLGGVEPAAVTDRDMRARAKDASYCLICFKGGSVHYYHCPKSPWADAVREARAPQKRIP